MSFELVFALPTRERRKRAPFHASVRDERAGRFTAADDAMQVARAADLAGFDGLFLPDDLDGEEPWVLASAIARETRHLRIAPEVSAGFGTAVYAAKLAFTFQRFFDDRLDWVLRLDAVAGDASAERFLPAEELLAVARGVWGEAPFDFTGRHFAVAGGALFGHHGTQDVRAAVRRFPRVFTHGDDDGTLRFSARHADVHVFHEREPHALAARIDRHRTLAAEAGRAPRYGLRVPIVAREYAAEAHDDRRRLIDAGHAFADAVTGTYAEVAERLHAYGTLGIETFVVDAVPRLEEAYRLGENLLPLLAAAPLERAG